MHKLSRKCVFLSDWNLCKVLFSSLNLISIKLRRVLFGSDLYLEIWWSGFLMSCLSYLSDHPYFGRDTRRYRKKPQSSGLSNRQSPVKRSVILLQRFRDIICLQCHAEETGALCNIMGKPGFVFRSSNMAQLWMAGHKYKESASLFSVLSSFWRHWLIFPRYITLISGNYILYHESVILHIRSFRNPRIQNQRHWRQALTKPLQDYRSRQSFLRKLIYGSLDWSGEGTADFGPAERAGWRN